MPRFVYKSVDPAGQVRRGAMDAASEDELARRVQAEGGMLLQARAASWRSALGRAFTAELGRRRGLSRKTVARLTRELAVMLESGQDLDHALRFMTTTARDAKTRALLQELRDRVRGGRSLASALAAFPDTFPRLYLGLVTAGEAGGKLAEALARLATMLEREQSLAATIQSSLAYPVTLVIAAIGSVTLLLTWVLPQFAPMFAEAGTQLPASTRMLMASGELVRENGLWLLLFMIAGAVLLRELARHPAQRRRLHRALLAIPVVGLLIRHVNAARLTRTLGTLLANGVGLLAALSICREVLSHLLAIDAVEQAIGRVREGRGMAPPLAESGAFPAETGHLLELGAETGRLAEMALRAADIHEERVRTIVQQLVSLMVPAITIVMGVVVAGIIGSLLVAMMSLNDLAR
jgi:general secretion pathway protein F